MTAKTYTIATANNMMIAIVPDGQDIAAEVERTAAEAGVTFDQFDTMTGLTLTDEPTADDQIVVYGDKMGRVTDEDGIGYLYAVKRRDDAAEQLQRMRRSDGTESVWFHWPDGASEAEVRGQYEYGYDHNDSDADVEAVIYSLASGEVSRWIF